MISRRRLLPVTLGAIVTGIAGGLVGANLSSDQASVRFIGRGESMIALLDTTTERALIVLGAPDIELLDHIPGMKTVGNTRVDLVVATHRILATRSARKHLNIGTTPTVSLQSSASIPPIRGHITPVTSTTSIGLGSSSSLEISVAGSGKANSDADHPHVLITVVCQNTRLVFASADAALRQATGGPCHVLALPGSAGEFTIDRMNPVLLVCNEPREDFEDAPQLPVFANEPLVIQIEDGAVRIRRDQFSS